MEGAEHAGEFLPREVIGKLDENCFHEKTRGKVMLRGLVLAGGGKFLLE